MSALTDEEMEFVIALATRLDGAASPVEGPATLTDEERAEIIATIEGDTDLPEDIKAGIVAAYASTPTLEEKAKIIEKMVLCLVRPGSQIPIRLKDRNQAEHIARIAYRLFHRHYAADLFDKVTTPVPVWFAEALAPVAAAGEKLREGINTMGKDVSDRLRQEFIGRGVNLDVLRLSLQVLAEVAADVGTAAESCSPKPKETRGAKKKDTTRAAVETVRYLMNYTQDRHAAAEVVEVMLRADPIIDPAQRIDRDTLVSACVRAGVGGRDQKQHAKKKTAGKVSK